MRAHLGDAAPEKSATDAKLWNKQNDWSLSLGLVCCSSACKMYTTMESFAEVMTSSGHWESAPLLRRGYLTVSESARRTADRHCHQELLSRLYGVLRYLF